MTVAAIAAALAALLVPAGAATAAPVVGGCQVFPPFTGAAGAASAADHTAWNQDVSQTPVAANSDAVIARIDQDGTEFHPDFGSSPDYGIPYRVVRAGRRDVPVRIGPNGYPDESDFGPAPLPADTPVEAGSDHHALVVRRGSCGLYELYRARYLGGDRRRWQADATAFFDLGLAGPLRNGGDYITSTDAAGLPVLAGLARYREVAAGAIEHALRITFEETRAAYLHPATHYASSLCGPNVPPMGLRLRLRSDYPTAGLGPQALVIVAALKRYGAIAADSGSNWYVTGQTSPNWDDDDLNALKLISGDDFEVVQSAAGPVVSAAC